MKQTLITIVILFVSVCLFAQGNSGKSKGKQKVDEKISVSTPGNEKSNNDHDKKIWEGVSGSGGCGIPSKNQPAKVRSSFASDYPNAGNVRWTKCRGDWTATFGNGLLTSTAVYHANGQRKDTRTPIEKTSLPRVILDDIFKRRPGINIGNIIRVELPVSSDPIFRVKVGPDTSPDYVYYNPQGVVVNYNY